LARWRFLESEASVVSELERVAGVDRLCARVLANRGVRPEDAPGFLSPSLKTVGMPEEEPWGVAARRVARAVKKGERIGIFGDYDTDGITSAAVLYQALSNYTENLVVKLPTRQTGYSLLEPYVRDLFAEGVDLLVTADCGISNRREVELANALGLPVHHSSVAALGRSQALEDLAAGRTHSVIATAGLEMGIDVADRPTRWKSPLPPAASLTS